MGVCNCSIIFCTLLYVHSSFAIILTGKRELVALLSLFFWVLLIVVWLFSAMPWVCQQFVIVAFHLLFLAFLLTMKRFKFVLNVFPSYTDS